jgi:hypothetical protein
MATYSYTVARQLLRFSDKKDNNNCPTPYNMSMLYRILNAEVMALFEIITIELKETFWEIKEQRKEPRPARLVYRSIMVFVVGICAR